MINDVYERLATHLNNLPAGFPRTESGVEIRILKRLFSEEEADIACNLRIFYEPVARIAKRLNQAPSELAETLYRMSLKGLISRADRDDGPSYMAAQFVIGIWEFQVNNLNEELIRDMNEYIPYLLDSFAKQDTKQLRIVPIGASLEGQGTVMPYDEARKLIESQKKIALAPCICRKEHRMIGEGCGKLTDACLVFSSAAYFYESNGMGRSISQEEALQILKRAEEEALVLQPTNAQKIFNICLCCGDCCQILKSIKRLLKPASFVHTNYYVEVDKEKCVGCEVCIDRCQMDAVRMEGEVADINLDRCIGCGLCVSTCSTGAIALIRKDEKDRYTPPENVIETYMKIAQERGLIK
jgi:NAD-dependent dihydropyrimidine dehydrogenase PreA subunit